MPDISTINVILPAPELVTISAVETSSVSIVDFRVGQIAVSGGGGGFTLNNTSSSVSISAGAGIGIGQAASTITVSASNQTSSLSYVAALGTAGATSTGTIFLAAGNNITLNTGANSITIVGATVATGGTQSFSGGGTSITGNQISVALFGGNNISLASASGAGSLSLTFNASSNALNNVSLLNGSSGALSISAGAGIGTGQAGSTITISNAAAFSSISMFGTSNVHISSSGLLSNVLTISAVGGLQVGVTDNLINLSAFSTVQLTASGNTTLGSSGTLSIASPLVISGAGIVSVGVGGKSITISATTPSVTNYSTITGTMVGNLLGPASTTVTIGNSFNLSAAGVASVGASGGTITISVPAGGGAAGTQSFSGGGTSITGTAISVDIEGGNNISLASASGAGSLTLTINASSNALNNVSLLNASSGALSISAGAGIGIGQAANTITISASVQTSNITGTMAGNTLGAASTTVTIGNSFSLSGAGIVSVGASAGTITISAPTPAVQTSSLSVTALGNTLGAASTSLAVSNALNISGAGIVSVGMNGSTITISATTPAVVNYSTISGNIVGNTALSSTFTIGNTFQLSLDGGLSGTASGSSITLSGAAAGAANTITLSISGNTFGIPSSTTVANSIVVSGAGAVSVAVGPSGQIEISSPLVPAKLSYTQNFAINQAAPVFIGSITTTGTTAATGAAMPFGSQLSLQRIFLPALMSLTEVDLAFGVSFPATNQGQGSISQSLIVYSFGNRTSLASVLSASRAVSWATGTTTSGTSSSLQQGWASNNIQPFTFAASLLSAGEYAVAHLMSWAAASTSWTISVFGNPNPLAGLKVGSVFTSSSSDAITAFSAAPGTGAFVTALASTTLTAFTAAPTNIAIGKVASTASFSTNTASLISATATAASTVSLLLNAGTASTSVVFGAGATLGGMQSIRTSGYSHLQTGGLAAGSLITATGFPSFAYNGTFAMTTNVTQASYLSGNFEQGIMATGGSAASIDLKSTAVTVTGSVALIQPWFALCGS